MKATPEEIWHDLIAGPCSSVILRTAIKSVARGLTDMLGRTIINDAPQLKEIPVAQMVALAHDPGAEVVGVYLQMESGLRGRVILIMPLDLALSLADLMTDAPLDTASTLGSLECSALAEIGNVALASFLNAVAEAMGLSETLHPSTPVVVVDMLDDILELIVKPAADMSAAPLVIEAILRDITKKQRFVFWMLPGAV